MAASTAPASLQPQSAPGARVSGLRCTACGSHEPVRQPARVHGWQRCHHCNTPIVAPWSDAEAHDGPASRTVVLELPGRVQFSVPRRTLLTSVELLAWLFIVNLLTAFAVGFFEIEPTPGGIWRWFGPLLCLLFGASMVALLVRHWRTVQHLEIGSGRLLAWRSVGSRRFAKRERRFVAGPAGSAASSDSLALTVEVDDNVHTVSENRFRVLIHSREADEKAVCLLLASRAEAEWMAVLIREAALPETERTANHCPGCAVSLDISLEEQAGGHINCPYCEAGFVVGVRDVSWAPVALPDMDLPGSATTPGPRVIAERRHPPHGGARKNLSWQVLQRRGLDSVVAALGLTPGVAFFAAFGVATIWLTSELPDGAWGLAAWMIGGGFMMFGIAGYAVFLIALQLAGREELGLDDATIWTTSRLGNIDLQGPWPIPKSSRVSLTPAGWHQPGERIPIARLTQVELERLAGETTLRLTTPTRSLEMVWVLPTAEDYALRRDILNALAERLRAVGREVTTVPGVPALGEGHGRFEAAGLRAWGEQDPARDAFTGRGARSARRWPGSR